MADQPSYDPLEPSRFFPDGMSARQPVPGTIARGQEWEDRHLLAGTKPGVPPTGGKERPAPSPQRPADYEDAFPFPVTAEVMQSGRERFNIFCAACHGRDGEGNGPVVQSGYPRAASFHQDRLRQVPAGYVFDVITHGYKEMPPYARQIAPSDRWAVVAYLRALQLSRHAELKTLPPDVRHRFEGTP
jgi:mono/diheme cytochrome c family protein